MAFSVPVSNIKSNRLSPKGSPSERIWIIAEAPLPKDQDKGFLFSSAMGWSYDKLIGESGIHGYYSNYFESREEAIKLINIHRPPIIVVLDKAATLMLPCIKSKEQVGLWAGSLLKCEGLAYDHYMIPTHGPETCISDWTERQIVKFIDYGHVKDEYDFWCQHGHLNPLPERKLDIDLDFHTLIYKLEHWADDTLIEYLSVDIETVYPKEKSEFYGHPGYPVTVGIAISEYYGISFSLFQDTPEKTIKLWRVLARLMWEKKIIGQNYFLFDSNFFAMLGMPNDLFKINDTMFMHSILWAELSHKLQFMTRQYTRQPYYKSEGHGWSIKNLSGLKKYNALDVTVTFEIFNKMIAEDKERAA